jgi:hypothetical protein
MPLRVALLLTLFYGIIFVFNAEMKPDESIEQYTRPLLGGKYKQVMYMVEKLSQGVIITENTLMQQVIKSKISYKKALRRIKEIDYQLPLINEEITVVKQILSKISNSTTAFKQQEEKNQVTKYLNKLLEKLEEDVPILLKEKLLMQDTVTQLKIKVEMGIKSYNIGREQRHETLKYIFSVENLLAEIAKENGVKFETNTLPTTEHAIYQTKNSSLL